jgi:hypothetical protein
MKFFLYSSLFLVIFAPVVSHSQINNNLVGRWTFDSSDISGTVADDVSASNNIGIISGALEADGVLGEALLFDGVDDYVIVSHDNSMSLSDEITITAWIRGDELSWIDTIVSKGTRNSNINYWLSTFNEDISFGTFNRTWRGVYTEGINLNKGEWHHIAATLDDKTDYVKIYVNGFTVAFFTFSADLIENQEALYIGRSQYATEYFNGAIDDVRIYNKVLSAGEIKELFDEGKKFLDLKTVVEKTPEPVQKPTKVITITRWMTIGITGADVKTLQKYLNANGYKLAETGPGSPGNETEYFGPITEVAVKKFQCDKGIVCSGTVASSGYGSIGPKTRAALRGE